MPTLPMQILLFQIAIASKSITFIIGASPSIFNLLKSGLYVINRYWRNMTDITLSLNAFIYRKNGL